MIILDANILKSTSLRGPAADVLRAIRAAKVEQVAAPWIAMEEIAAQQVLSYQGKHDAAMEAVKTLRKATPWADIPHPQKFDAEHVRKHWRQRYSEIADVIETSASAYQMAMFRETNLIAPCKTVNSGKNKTGARDAAIWLTAVEYAKAHPAETVYFVSNNTDDFGNGTCFPSPMDKDLQGMEDRFFLFTSLDGVLTKFATEVEADAEDVRALLETEEAYATVLATAWASGKHYRTITGSQMYKDSDDVRAVVRSSRWEPRAVALSKVLEVSAREIVGHKWFTASVRWLLAESGLPRHYTDERDRIAFAWETRVLLSPTASEKGLTVLDGKRPGPVTSDDAPNVPIIAAPDDLALLTKAANASEAPVSPRQLRAFLQATRRDMPDRHGLEELTVALLSDRAGHDIYRRLEDAVKALREEDFGGAL
ncbi:PIN domain-containing protein [Streptomyces sp. NPDC058409]|uniref:PIN domain-containing protein n=1 Tax=Streptomyces sp. NPDC058409 TaxID=3346484 RepID=UPI003652DE7A